MIDLRRASLRMFATFVLIGSAVSVSWVVALRLSSGGTLDGSLEAAPRRQTVAPALAQVRGVSAVHRAGQTFITWREIDAAPKQDLTIAELNGLKRALQEGKGRRYRIYRSERPIQRISEAILIGEVPPLSVWDAENFGVYPPADAHPPRYVIEEGKGPLPSGTGLFVYNPGRPGMAYYVVTSSVGGSEDSAVTPDNSTAVGNESVSPGVPVLQRIESPSSFQYVDRASIRYYVRWESATNSNVAGKAFDYLVGVPPNVRYPAPVGLHLHAWGGSMRDGYGWWYNAEKGAILVSSNQVPYDWWTGYHEQLGKGPLSTPEEWKKGVVRPYSQRRLLAFVDWLATTMKLDLSRMFVAGNSMGGSGAIMLAIRYPTRVAWAISWVGVHVPALSPQFKSSYEGAYGKPEWGVLFENGTAVWDHYSDVWYLQHHRDVDVALLTFSNGKNDSGIGWPQAVQFFRALQETRQPHVFFWGQGGHGERAYMPAGGGERNMPLDLRTDQSLPAFTRGSLDGDPGSGTPESGAPEGQANAHLTWRTDSIIDEPGRWAITIAVAEGAPRSTASVDVTPRRLQQFKLKPGDRVEWTNTGGSSVVQGGELTADQWGLITVPQAQVSRGGNRITVIRK